MKSTFNPCVRLFEEVSVSWSLPEVGIAEIEKKVREEILTVSQTKEPSPFEGVTSPIASLMFGILKNERLSPLLPPAERTPTVSSMIKGQKSKTGFVFKQFIIFKCVFFLKLGLVLCT